MLLHFARDIYETYDKWLKNEYGTNAQHLKKHYTSKIT